ncbi:MAG: Uma2 family endonuclease [Acidimicrobiales bacterium]
MCGERQRPGSSSTGPATSRPRGPTAPARSGLPRRGRPRRSGSWAPRHGPSRRACPCRHRPRSWRRGGGTRPCRVGRCGLRGPPSGSTRARRTPFDWRTPDGGSVEPDIVAMRRSDFDPDGPLSSIAVPLLLVEILSRSSHKQDLLLKRGVYEGFGVPAYWIVDPAGPSMLVLTLREGRYATEIEVDRTGTLELDWPFPVRMALADLLA